MSNLQKAFKNKARFGLRMAAGGLLTPSFSQDLSKPQPTSNLVGNSTAQTDRYKGIDPSLWGTSTPGLAGSALANQGMSQGLSGAWSMDSGSGAAGTAAQPEGLRAAQPAAQPAPAPVQPLAQNNGFYKPGAANDPHASGLAPTAPKVVAAPVAEPSAPVPNMMTPVDQLLPSRQGLRLADGGVVETPDQLMARMAKKYGGGAAAAVQPQPAPTPVVQTPAPAPVRKGIAGAFDALKNRKAQIDEAAGFAEGGIVRGKGGVDNVPMNVNGVDVNLTGGKAPEAVLPSKTVQALGGPEAVEELIERTNGKPPVRSGLREGGAYGNGLVNISDTPDPRFVKKYGPTDDAPAAEKLASASMGATLGDRVKPGALATANDAPAQVAQEPVSTQVPPSAQTSLREAERTLADTAPDGWAEQDLGQEASDAELGARVLGSNAAVPKGLRGSFDASGGRRLDFTSSNNAANDSMNQGLRKTNGEGVASMRQKDGTFKNIVLGASQTKWADGPEYKAAMEQSTKDKVTLRDMQHDRIKRTAAMPGATQGDLVALADQEKSDALYNDQIKSQNENEFRKQDLGLRREQNGLAQQNIIADNRRADAAQRASVAAQQQANSAKVSDAMEKMLDTYVPTTGLKDDALASAQAKRARVGQAMLETYGGQLPPDLETFHRDAVKNLHQARLTEALNEAVRNRGPIDIGRNVVGGLRKPTVSQDPNLSVDRDGWTIQYGAKGGVPLFARDVVGGDADLAAALDERIAKQKKSHQATN